MNRLYFIGSNALVAEFAHYKGVAVDQIIHVRTTLKVKQIVPGSDVYVSHDSITSAKLYVFCKERGNVRLKSWTVVHGEI